MREIGEGLRTHLDGETTTLCTCWIIERTDGERLGFTDHDEALEIEGVACEAASGFVASEAVSELGLAADNQDIAGALDSERLTLADLIAGRFDNARVEVWMVNWHAPDEHVLLRTAILGEVSKEDGRFRAELRGLASILDQSRSRRFISQCDAVLGDAKCGIDLENAAYKAAGTVTGVTSRLSLQCSGLEAFDDGWFAHGSLVWTSGANDGLRVEISQSDVTGLTLWKAMPHEVAEGDTFDVFAGCNKRFTTCKTKFNNHLNFRGFPHIPGPDFALSYAGRDAVYDGGIMVE